MNYASMSDKELVSSLYASPAVTPLVRELQMRMERLLEEADDKAGNQAVQALQARLDRSESQRLSLAAQLRRAESELDDIRIEAASDERTCCNCGERI